MAHVRSSRFRQRSGVSRRLTAWSVGPVSPVIDIAAAGANLFSANSQAIVDGLTIVRLRGEYTFSLRTVTTIGDGWESAAVGVCIVSENAAAVGVTAVPSPLADVGWDGWLFHRLHGAITGLNVTEVQSTFNSFRIEMDSRAMRKQKQTDVLIGVVELGTEIGAASVEFSCQTRVLDKLP